MKIATSAAAFELRNAALTSSLKDYGTSVYEVAVVVCKILLFCQIVAMDSIVEVISLESDEELIKLKKKNFSNKIILSTKNVIKRNTQ